MSQPKAKRENLFVNLICSLILPVLILTKLSADDRLGHVNALILAVLLPLGYGAYDFYQRRVFNFIAALGLANVLVTGFIGLTQLDGIWVAVKEAAFPCLISFAILGSMRSKNPLVKTFLYNDQILDVPRIEDEIDANGNRQRFRKLFDQATYIFLLSLGLSAVLNYVLAKAIVTAPGGSAEFNEQIGRMNFLSYFVIMIPSTIVGGIAMWKLYGGIMKLSGLKFEDLFAAEHLKEKAKASKG